MKMLVLRQYMTGSANMPGGIVEVWPEQESAASADARQAIQPAAALTEAVAAVTRSVKGSQWILLDLAPFR